MNAAEALRAEVAAKNKEIIETIIEPKRERILSAVAEGIRRIGYVTIDTSGYDTSSMEGRMTGIYDSKYLNALAEWLSTEGFNVSRRWWGCCSGGDPDMLTIKL